MSVLSGNKPNPDSIGETICCSNFVAFLSSEALARSVNHRR